MLTVADVKAAIARHGSVDAALCADPAFAAEVSELVAQDPEARPDARERARWVHYLHSEGFRPVHQP